MNIESKAFEKLEQTNRTAFATASNDGLVFGAAGRFSLFWSYNDGLAYMYMYTYIYIYQQKTIDKLVVIGNALCALTSKRRAKNNANKTKARSRLEWRSNVRRPRRKNNLKQKKRRSSEHGRRD